MTNQTNTIWSTINTAEALAERFPDFEAVDEAFEFERDCHGHLRHFNEYECGGITPSIQELAEQRRLWTMVDGEGRSVWICAGCAFVNRLTYLATLEPAPQSFIDLGLAVKG